jgi:hypothetical protein
VAAVTAGFALRAAVALALWCLATSGRAVATTVARPPNLEVVIVGDAATADLLAVAIAPLLADLEPVTWKQMRETTSVSRATLVTNPDVVRVWVDAHREGTVTVVGFSRRGAPRVRSVAAPELTPVLTETVAQIVHETAVALFAGEAAGAPLESATTAEATSVVPDAEVPAPIPQIGETVTAPPTLASPVDLSLAFGYVVRQMATFSNEKAHGLAISTTVWLKRETVRSFVTLSLEYLESPSTGNSLNETSIVTTFGISWLPRGIIDIRTAIGIGAARINYALPAWYPIERAVTTVGVLLPRRLEATVALMLDVVGLDPIDPRGVQPAAMFGLAWRP